MILTFDGTVLGEDVFEEKEKRPLFERGLRTLEGCTHCDR